MIAASTAFILGLSLTTLYSIQASVLTAQITAIIIGLVLAFLIYKFDLIILRSLSWGFYIFALLLLISVFFLGTDIRGSTRWFDLGLFNLQPSEVVKPLLAIFFAHFLSLNPPQSLKNISTYLGLLSLPVILIFLEPDLGSSLAISFLGLSLLFFAKVPYRYVLAGITIFLVILLPAYSLLAPYQKARVTSFINPHIDPQGAGYNVIQSTIAIGSGGFIGLGLKQGVQSQLKFLPERHTDFIFASFIEEFGLFGGFLLLGAFLLLFLKAKSLIINGSSDFNSLLAAGIVSIFIFEITVNIAVNLGLLPVTGITLPLFSYGGSSIVSHLTLIGLLLLLDKPKATL